MTSTMGEPEIMSQDPNYEFPDEQEHNSSPIKVPKAQPKKRKPSAMKKTKSVADLAQPRSVTFSSERPKRYESDLDRFQEFLLTKCAKPGKELTMVSDWIEKYETLSAEYKETATQALVDKYNSGEMILDPLISIGKFKGKTWKEVWAHETQDGRDSGRGWIEWIAKNGFTPPILASARYFISMQEVK